jgi:hypothetical protein
MTLPFADKPEDSRVYTDLKTLDLSQLSQDEFNTLRQSMESQGVNGLEDEYRRLILLQMAGNNFPSGPLAQSKIVTKRITSSGVVETVFRPAVGEVWRILGLAGVVANRSGTVRTQIYISDGTTDMDIVLFDASSSNLRPMSDADYPDTAIFLTNDTYFAIENTGSGGGTYDYVEWYLNVIRVR